MSSHGNNRHSKADNPNQQPSPASSKPPPYSNDAHPTIDHDILLPSQCLSHNKFAQTTILQHFFTPQATPTNLDQNTTFGHPVEAKPDGICRLISQNINSIGATTRRGPKATELGQSSERLKADILAIQETNVAAEDAVVTRKIFSQFRPYWNRIKFKMGSSTLRDAKSAYLPGGTAILVGSPWHGHSTFETDNTDMGRWTEITLTGNLDSRVTIINAYRVCEYDPRTPGISKAYLQQSFILRNMSNLKDPREVVLEDLTARIQQLQESGHEVIVTMDANDNPDGKTSFTRWIAKNKLTDVHAAHHGIDGEPNTHDRGTRRIDYIFATADIFKYIVRSTILPFKDICYTDHRALLIDIDLQKFLRCKAPPTPPKDPRGISSSKPIPIKEFRKAFEQILNESTIELDLDNMNQRLIDDPSNFDPTELNRIDARLTQILLQLDDNCKVYDVTPWSPALIKAKHAVRYWRLWQSQLKLNIDFAHQRSRLHVNPTCPIDNLTPITVADQLRKARIKLIKAFKNADDLRKEHLQHRADMAEASGNITAKKAIKAIIAAEQSSGSFSTINAMLGKKTNGSLHQVDIVHTLPNGHQVTHTVSGKQDLEEAILQRNQRHFSQAEGTPFASDHLRQHFGRLGTNFTCQQILDKQFDTHTLSATEATKSLLNNLQRYHPKNHISDHISADDLRQGYKVWRESTSTSPSGRHLGLDKAFLKYENNTQPDDDKPTLSDRYFSIKANIINMAVQSGTVLDRWKTIHSLMLPKKAGNRLLEKLRCIHIIENDFNLMLGIIFNRRTMYAAEDINALGDENAGGRKGRSAEEIHLLKQLLYSTIRLTRTSAISFDNDAKSCFDRIVIALLNIILQQHGNTDKSCEILAKTLQEVEYYIKTDHGTSTESFGGIETHGALQGGRASTAFWSYISAVLIKSLKSTHQGFTATDPRQRQVLHIITSGFVDDCTNWTNTFHADLTDHHDQQKLLEQGRSMSQRWNDLIHASGGKLELPKCLYYLLEHEFDDEGIPNFKAKTDNIPTISLTGPHGDTIPIDQLDPSQPHVTLGSHDSPAEYHRSENQRLLLKSQQFARSAATTHLPPHESQVFYNLMYIPSISYSFASCSLTKEQCENIQSRMVHHTLSNMGFNRNMAREQVYASKSVLGLGLTHLFSKAGTEKTLSILRFLRMDRPTSQAMIVAFQWAQLHAGISESIFVNTRRLPHLRREQWITTLRHFLQLSYLRLHIPEIHTPPLLRNNDRFIMDIALDTLSHADTERVNQCRLYLRTTRLSDIVTEDGSRITQQAYQCTEPFKSLLLWPVQVRPGPKHLRTWKRFMSTLCSNNFTHSLKQKLGNWTILDTHDRPRQAYHDPDTHSIYRRTQKNPIQWEALHIDPEPQIRNVRTHGTASRSSDHTTVLTHDELRNTLNPTNATPVTIRPDRLYDNRFVYSQPSRTATAHPPLKPEEADNWTDYITRLPEWEQDLVQHAQPNYDDYSLHDLIDNLRNTSNPTDLMIVSDGSAIGDYGAYGWVLGTDSEIHFSSAGAARGYPMQSHRAEAYGKISWLAFLHCIVRYYDIPRNPKLIIRSYLDNLDIQKSTATDTPTKHNAHRPLRADHDIIHETQLLQKQLRHIFPNLLDTEHVKGHQDDKKLLSDLSREALMNYWADHHATEANRQLIQDGPPPPMIPFPHCPVYLADDTLALYTSLERETLLWRWREYEQHKYLARKFKIPPNSLEDINWFSLRLAINRLTSAQQRFVPKLATDWIPTGKRRSIYEKTPHPCLKCKHHNETVDHIFQCPATRKQQTDYLHRLADYLYKLQTDPAIIKAIIHGATIWLKWSTTTGTIPATTILQALHTQPNPSAPTPPTLHPDAQHAMNTQNDIGWNLWFRGLHHNSWSTAQARYLLDQSLHNNTKNSDPDATTWNRKLIQWQLTEAHKTWCEYNASITDFTDESVIASIQDRVRNLYELAEHTLDPHERLDTKIPLHDMLTNNPKTLQAWLKHALPLTHRLIKDKQQRESKNLQDIRTFFPVHNDNRQDTPVTLSQPPTSPTTAQLPIKRATTEIPKYYKLKRRKVIHKPVHTLVSPTKRTRPSDIRQFLTNPKPTKSPRIFSTYQLPNNTTTDPPPQDAPT